MGTLTNVNPTPLPSAGWKQTFFDGFDGAFLDRSAWPLVFWGGSNNGAYTFQPGNVVVWDGEVSANSISTPAGWTSGAFQQGWNGQLYGRFEIRAKYDEGQGTSGALLLWPTDDEGGAEVDINETRAADRTLNNITVHGKGPFFSNVESREFRYDASEWHTYTVDWLPGELVFYLDGQELYRTNERVPDEMMSFGVLGYVNAWEDWWQGGPPDATSPASSGIHLDWVRIYTPENLYPGALPTALYGVTGAMRYSTEPWTGTWVAAGNTGEFARSGVRSSDGVTYAATWNAAQWNDQLPVVASAPAVWDPANATRLLYANFTETQLDFSAAGTTGLAVVASGAQRGNIRTGAGNDSLTWVAQSVPGAAPDSTMTINMGAGHDSIVVTSAGRSNIDQPFAWGGQWRGDYDGRASVFRINLGAGDDWVTPLVGGGVVDGGTGEDAVVFWGARPNYAVTAQADGSTRVDDLSGAQGSVVLWAVERLLFAETSGITEVAPPGQAPAPFVIDIAAVLPVLAPPRSVTAAAASSPDPLI